MKSYIAPSFCSTSHIKQKDRDLAQFVEARRKALARLQTISENTSSASVHPIKPQKDTAEASELEGWSSCATLEANAGDAERISKLSSSPDVPSKEAEELDSPSTNTKISMTSDGSASFQDSGCDTEVEACLKGELEIAVTHQLPMTNYTSVPQTTTIKLDLSETSSACPIKMG